MGDYSLSDAKDRLSALIDRAQSGEGVVIVRDGRPVAELRPIHPGAAPLSAADLDWLAARRIRTKDPAENAGELLRGLRDGQE
ncbi:MAG TPA: type II toxin-antitoxin system prevent-host-death family antitoxin [Lichenihabitans sp.]|jgi:prevent-host-death family protein|nr:type II toxin-antitoxin system prevent-host-death family antitoxin [Lichenihabitans sp.]